MQAETPTKSGYRRLFYGWDVRPDRDQEWYDEKRNDADDEARFEKEYPRTADEALAPARTLMFFRPETLEAMRQDIALTIEEFPIGAGFYANIYQKFQVGNKYAAATDTSHGVGQDFGVTVIINVETGYVVADFMSALAEPEQLSIASMDLLDLYRNPIWGIEDNDWGISTIKVAVEAHYPRLYTREDGNVGWHTSDTRLMRGSRYNLWTELASDCNARALRIPNEEGLAQFYTVIRNPDKHGKIEAQIGAFDDYPMTVGIALQISDRAQRARSTGRREKEDDIVLGIDGESMRGRNFPAPSMVGDRLGSRQTPYGW